MRVNLHNAAFVKSAASKSGFIADHLPKVCFSGKSNVGKSSVINRLLGRKSFARVAAKPGKTAHVNYFDIDGKLYFVDLPGYGYAKVSKTERERWSVLMECFFADPTNVTLGIMIVDSRHAPTADDLVMASWFIETGSRFIVVANKLDKLKKSEIEPNINLIRQRLGISDNVRIIPFSAETGQGKDELLDVILSREDKNEVSNELS